MTNWIRERNTPGTVQGSNHRGTSRATELQRQIRQIERTVTTMLLLSVPGVIKAFGMLATAEIYLGDIRITM